MKRLAKAILILILINLVISCFAMRIKHPEYTETQLFFNIPKAFIWNL